MHQSQRRGLAILVVTDESKYKQQKSIIMIDIRLGHVIKLANVLDLTI